MTVVDTCCDLVKREFPSIDEDLFQYVKGKKKKTDIVYAEKVLSLLLDLCFKLS